MMSTGIRPWIQMMTKESMVTKAMKNQRAKISWKISKRIRSRIKIQLTRLTQKVTW